MGSAVTPENYSEAQRLVREAVAATEVGDHERAVELLNLALSLNGDQDQALLRLSREAEGTEYRPDRVRRMTEAAAAPDHISDAELPVREVQGAEHQPFRVRRMMEAAAAPDHISSAELLVREGIAASKAGKHARALDLLSLGLTLDKGHIQGWLWLSNEVEDPEDKAFCLRRVLALDPGNEFARRGLDWLKEQDRWDEQSRKLQDLRQAVGAWEDLEAAVEAEEPLLVEPELDWEIGSAMAPVVIMAGSGESAQGVRTGPIKKVRETVRGRAWPAIRSEFTVIALVGLVLLALIALGVSGLPAPLPLLRLLLGLAFVLFVPGYAMQAALFPRKDDLDGPERLALSFGLSVAVIPVLALVLDWLPWGLRLWPIVAAEGLVIGLFSAAALIRRSRLPIEARPLLSVNLDLRGWWAAQDRTGRVLYTVLACALLLALISATAIILSPKPGEQFTEFYLLGPDGLAESYPREATPGQQLSVTAGIANREGQTAEYRIEVQVGGESIAMAGPVTLEDGEVWEAPVSYSLARPGDDQQIEFLLYRDGGQEPYRRLQLWINIVEASSDGSG